MEQKPNQQKNSDASTPSFNRLHEVIAIREEQQRRLHTSTLHHLHHQNLGTICVTPYLVHYSVYLDISRPHLLLPIFHHQQPQVINYHPIVHFPPPQTPCSHPRLNSAVLYNVNNASNTQPTPPYTNNQRLSTPVCEIAPNPPPPGTTPIPLPTVENDVSRLLRDYRCVDSIVQPLPPRFNPTYTPPSPSSFRPSPHHHHHRVDHLPTIEHHQTSYIVNENSRRSQQP